MSSLVRRALALLVVVVLAAVAVVALFGSEAGRRVHLSPASGGDSGADPLSYSPSRQRELEDAAMHGDAHVIYAKSPGGARASAERTARYRPLIEAAATPAGIDSDTLEAIVLLESAGRADAVADPQLEGAVGLTQILAATGRSLLGMRVDPAAARRIGRSLRRALRRGDGALVQRLLVRRARVDERFDPAKSLAASARYLVIARKELGREDLAVVSYHMGIGNLQTALSLYGEDDVPYAQLYFDSTPLRHAQAWQRLASLGDDSSTYLWRVLAARDIMRLYRSDPQQLDRISQLQNAKNSAEEVLHPRTETERFASPAHLREGYLTRKVVALPSPILKSHGVRIDRQMGELGGRLGQSRLLYRGLRPEALALLVVLAAGTKNISGQSPLVLTSTVRDQRYQRLLLARNREATPNYSLHTTGFAFDILRSYRSRSQALALEFMLGRLQSLDLIAWVREPAAIHVTVSSRARGLLGVLAE
ncbi:MAG TPA: transglycosylase SLT domain-containing protein [Solirubrobacteraceae bacterium]